MRSFGVHRVLNIHVRKRCHQEAILRVGQAAQRDKPGVHVINDAAILGLRRWEVVEETGTKEDDVFPGGITLCRNGTPSDIVALLKDFTESNVGFVGACDGRTLGSELWVRDVRAGDDGLEHLEYRSGVGRVEKCLVGSLIGWTPGAQKDGL